MHYSDGRKREDRIIFQHQLHRLWMARQGGTLRGNEWHLSRSMARVQLVLQWNWSWATGVFLSPFHACVIIDNRLSFLINKRGIDDRWIILHSSWLDSDACMRAAYPATPFVISYFHLEAEPSN